MLERTKQVTLRIVAMVAVFLLLEYFIHITGFGIPCVIFTVTGLYCPGCGTMRAIIALKNLDFYQAFRYNMFFVACIPYLVVWTAHSTYRYIRYGENTGAGKYDIAAAVITAIGAVLFMVARNTSVLHFLAPVTV